MEATVYFDGSYRRQRAAWSWLVLIGGQIVESGAKVTSSTNGIDSNHCEWSGLISALEWLASEPRTVGRITVLGDSENVICWLQTGSGGKRFKRQREQAHRLAGLLWCKWSYRKISRAENWICDRLAAGRLLSELRKLHPERFNPIGFVPRVGATRTKGKARQKKMDQELSDKAFRLAYPIGAANTPEPTHYPPWVIVAE